MLGSGGCKERDIFMFSLCIHTQHCPLLCCVMLIWLHDVELFSVSSSSVGAWGEKYCKFSQSCLTGCFYLDVPILVGALVEFAAQAC